MLALSSRVSGSGARTEWMNVVARFPVRKARRKRQIHLDGSRPLLLPRFRGIIRWLTAAISRRTYMGFL
jgi:hypothetical protein